MPDYITPIAASLIGAIGALTGVIITQNNHRKLEREKRSFELTQRLTSECLSVCRELISLLVEVEEIVNGLIFEGRPLPIEKEDLEQRILPRVRFLSSEIGLLANGDLDEVAQIALSWTYEAVDEVSTKRGRVDHYQISDIRETLKKAFRERIGRGNFLNEDSTCDSSEMAEDLLNRLEEGLSKNFHNAKEFNM